MEPLCIFEHDGRALRLFAYPREGGPDPEPARPTPAPFCAVHYSRTASSCAAAPGSGRFAFERLEVALRDDRIAVTARITGTGIAYVYAELLLRDPAGERYYGPARREHVASPRTKETRGSIRPVWDDPVDVAMELRPELRILTDETASVLCFSTPGLPGDAVRRLEGLYTPAGGDRSLRATLTFGAGDEVGDVVVRTGRGRRSLPRVVAPRPGDRFAPFVTTLVAPVGPGGWVSGTAIAEDLTFSASGPRVEVVTLGSAYYAAGVVAQDLDGGFTREYLPVGQR